ncbi:MAG: hypothetical protein LBS13_04060 [Enterobacter cloacae]|jgi:hypothetical protein|nr:hypothetical protein [Enterobacter cloacae]
MKSLFKGYVAFMPDLNLSEIKKSTICFDTSALLNIYRYPKAAADDFIKAMEYFHKNIWLPYIVALEYQTNRVTVLQQQSRVFDELLGRCKRFKDDVSGVFSDKQHHSLKHDNLIEMINKFEAEFNDYIESTRNRHPNYFREDTIQAKLMELFDNKIGSIPTKEQLEVLYDIGESRFSNKIPPGYKDSKNKEHEFKLFGDMVIRSKYADFLIWNEIVEQAKNTNKSVILVTDERKEDWCWKDSNIILGARPELVTEVSIKAGVDFRLISSNQFISFASTIRKISISKTTVTDIEDSLFPSWKDMVLQAFREIGPIVKLEQLYEWIEDNKIRPLTSNWKATARKTIYYYCKSRDLFQGREELFEALDDATYRLIDF